MQSGTVQGMTLQPNQDKQAAHYTARYLQYGSPQQPQPCTWLWQHFNAMSTPSATASSNSMSIPCRPRHSFGLLPNRTAVCCNPPSTHHNFSHCNHSLNMGF